MAQLKVFGIKWTGSGWLILIVLPAALLIAYLLSCIVLYAFVRLTGLLSFSWLNGVWATILILTAYCIFGHSGGND